MKKAFMFLAAAFLSLCSSAQVINGDLDEDNDVTVNDAVLLVNDYVSNTRHYVKGAGSDPFAIDNSAIVGKWYETKSKFITFNADGTTDYGTGYTYECMPFLGNIVFYNASGAPVNVLDIVKCTSTSLILSPRGSNALTIYSSQQPEDLSSGTHNGYDWVDLGTGVKWATMNVGASSPEDYGHYFAWGATKPQSVYDWVNCPYQTQNTTDWSSTKFTKYLGSTTSSYKDSSATDANAKKTVLDAEDDAAHVNWGGNWRMPTKAEQDALRSQCYWQWVTTYNGKSVNGYIVYKAKADADKGKRSYNNPSLVGSYSVSDPHIFLPAAGYRNDSDLYSAGSYGSHWSSSLNESNLGDAYSLSFGSSYVDWYSSYRYRGRSVRAVCQ